MLDILVYVVRELFLAVVWILVGTLMLGGAISYAIKCLTNSGKELIEVYFKRKERAAREMMDSINSSSKNVN